MEPQAREIALECCVYSHGRVYHLYCAMIIPDHVHMIVTPYDRWTLPKVLRGLKGVSARLINLSRNETGSVWQSESFDRAVRSDENIRAKAEYTINNPVRANLVTDVEEYPWKWRLWIEGSR